MVQDPFPRAALADNRAGRLTAGQISSLRLDAKTSKRSGVMAGVAILAFGLLILWGTLAGRVPGSRLQPLAVGGIFVLGGGLLLRAGGMTRGPRAAEAASESTVLDVLEGPFRRERHDRNSLGDNIRSTRGSARYLYYLYVGPRQFSVSESAYNAAPDDGIVRVYLLPASDRVVNLERIGEAPPTAIEARAAAILQERFGALPGGGPPSAAKGATTPAVLRAALLGRWQAQGMPLGFEFRADGTVVSGDGSADEAKRWEVLDAERVRIDGEEQRVQVEGDDMFLVTRGPTFRFRRVH